MVYPKGGYSLTLDWSLWYLQTKHYSHAVAVAGSEEPPGVCDWMRVRRAS